MTNKEKHDKWIVRYVLQTELNVVDTDMYLD